MQRIGFKTGLELSPMVCGVMKWGIWGANLRTDDIHALIETSLDLGITTFDHADIYGHYTTETAFGEVLRQTPVLRQSMEIVTKCGIQLVTPNRPNHRLKSYNTRPEHIIMSVENSLRHLNTDYIDLLLLHRPSPLMHPNDIAETFAKLQQSGKVRHFGVSNFTPSQFDLLHEAFPLVTNQVQASILHRLPFWDGTFDQALRHNCPPMVWSPLGGGQIFQPTNDPTLQRIQNAATRLAEQYNTDLDQILLAWLLHHPARLLPVVGTARKERLEKAAQALTLQLTDEDWFDLLEAAEGKEVA